MSYADYLRELLRPLGVYDLNAPLNGGELEAEGLALDGAETRLEEVLREIDLTAAESWGLEKIAGLLARRPVAEEPKDMAAALAALLRIGGDSFTLTAINDTIAGCGVAAQVTETGVGTVAVSFPGVAGIPTGFAGIQRIIEDILPPHLEITYVFQYTTWAKLEQNFPTWKSIEDRKLTWELLEITQALEEAQLLQ